MIRDGRRERGDGKDIKRIFFVFFLFTFSHLLSPFTLLPSPISVISPAHAAQITAEARVLKSKVKIGDEIRLLLKVDHPRAFTVTAPDAKMKLDPFEIKSLEPIPAKKGQNRVEETYRMTLIAFQTGKLLIPPIRLSYTDGQGRPGEVKSEPVQVEIVSVGKKLTDKDDIRPIKGPVSDGLANFWSGVYGLLAAALSIFLIVRLILRYLNDRASAESRKSPDVRAKIELNRLKDKGYLEEKKYREFYSGLSEILRQYFERRFRLNALEETTTETMKELEKLNLDPEVLKKTAKVLTESDLVKFAKVIPPYELAGELEALILEVAQMTRPVSEKK